MRPSTGSSYTTSATSRPTWGCASGAPSIFTARAGRAGFWKTPYGSPVSGARCSGEAVTVVVAARVVEVVDAPVVLVDDAADVAVATSSSSPEQAEATAATASRVASSVARRGRRTRRDGRADRR